MAYYSTVGAAIGGLPEQIHAFAQQLKLQPFPDKFEILKQFQIISIDSDFSIFVFYHDAFKWYEEAIATWNHLCQLAIAQELPYVFYRIGEEPGDTEEYSHYSGDALDERMEELFEFNFNLNVNAKIQLAF